MVAVAFEYCANNNNHNFLVDFSKNKVSDVFRPTLHFDYLLQMHPHALLNVKRGGKKHESGELWKTCRVFFLESLDQIKDEAQ